MLTEQDLKRAEELCEKATPGEWRAMAPQPCVVSRGMKTVCLMAKHKNHDEQMADADFIAESRTLMPKLLDEVERLNEVIESAVALAVLGDLETIKQIKVQHG